ncbi:MAG: HAD family phosphatase [Chitinophagaceae bacterium]|nr:HAD family phosphatase [Chitinophagaceae bacterium]
MNNSDIKALLFDLNGTMIDDMAYHAVAWRDILNKDLNANLTEAQVKEQMYGKNEEVLERIFGKGHFTKQEANRISFEKEKRYQKAFLPQLKLIEGLNAFLAFAHSKNIPMAIGSAAIPFNIDFVLDNLHIRHYFSAIVSADDVKMSKPDPETFTNAAKLLNVKPQNCIVFEDAPKGVEAAQNAHMKAIVLTTMHTRNEFEQYNNILGFIKNYNNPLLKQLIGFDVETTNKKSR